jgi:hypothetical protein
MPRTTPPEIPQPRARPSAAPVALAVFALAACVDKPAIHNLGFRPAMSDPLLTTLSRTIDLIADNQQFHIGGGAYLFRSGYIDKSFSASDVRVPQQDVFGGALLELAAGFNQGRLPAVHLGDALDVSCVDEWATFARIMDARKDWFFTPGNHDGYFFGNFVNAWWGQWDTACDGSKPMNKTEVIQAYLAHLQRYAPELGATPTGSWTCAGACQVLRKVSWHTERDFWHSFIVQELDLSLPKKSPGVSMILIDTSTYKKAPALLTSSERSWNRLAAGELGSLDDKQTAIIDDWVRAARAEGRIVILAGHHHYDSLDSAGRAALTRLHDRGSMASYFSGHTHHGQYFVHAGSKTSWLEMNLGSILDHNPEFAELTVYGNGRDTQIRPKRILASSLASGREMGAQYEITCEPQWLPRAGDPDFFVNYKQVTSLRPSDADKQYYLTMIWALERYWRMVPTTAVKPGAKYQTAAEVTKAVGETAAKGDLGGLRTLALELLRVHNERVTNTRLARSYQVCMSLWGAEYERRDVVTPTRDEDVFEIGGPT